MDVKTAFSNGQFEKEIFVKVQEGIKCEGYEICQLNKALYVTFWIVGLKVIKLLLVNNDEITLHQSAHVITGLIKIRQTNCEPISTPMESKLSYEYLNFDENCKAPCRSVICRLMYWMICTRPNMGFSGELCKRYLKKNNEELLKYSLRI